MSPDCQSMSTTEGLAARCRGALLPLVVAGLLATGLAHAQAPTVLVNGRPLAAEHAALNRGGALLLPLRALGAALGAEVQWYADERKAELRRGDSLVELWMMTPVAQVNRNPVQLASPPVLQAGTAYLPLRLVSEAFGCAVRWDAATRTVNVGSPPDTCGAQSINGPAACSPPPAPSQ